MVNIEWKIRSDTPFNTDFKQYISKVRGIDNIEEYLNPPSSVVNSPYLLKNIRQGIERVKQGISKTEKIVVFADPDPDGIIATVMMVDYLKKITNNIEYYYRERETGHGINEEDIPTDTDLLIIVDSSSSEVIDVNALSKHMDVIILDHHNVEEYDEELKGILINPNQEGCEYPNKHLSGSGVVFRFIEILNYHYKKVHIDYYLDLVGTTLLSDSMNMTSMENRYFLKKGLENINNVGLLALVKESKNQGKELTSNIFNFNIIPVLNTATRNNEIGKAFDLLLESNFNKAKNMAKEMIEANEERKKKVKLLVKQYEKIMQTEKFIYVVTPDATKNYNGLVAQKLSSKYRKPCLVLKDDGEKYQGSFRSYNNFDLQTFLKGFSHTEFAAGHLQAGGFSISVDHWEEFKRYVNQNIDDSLFKEVIEYDIELEEDDISWEIINDIVEFDRLYGKSAPQVSVRINDVFVHDRELFPKSKQEHVKIKSEHLDILKFNDPSYAEEVGSFDQIDAIGTVSINEFRGDRRIQLMIEDYKVN